MPLDLEMRGILHQPCNLVSQEVFLPVKETSNRRDENEAAKDDEVSNQSPEPWVWWLVEEEGSVFVLWRCRGDDGGRDCLVNLLHGIQEK